TALHAPELSRITCLGERAHEVCCTREHHASTRSRSLDAECDCEVRLAGADRSGEQHVLRALDPSARASSAIRAASTPSATLKSNWSSVFISGKRASRTRWRIADSRRD